MIVVLESLWMLRSSKPICNSINKLMLMSDYFGQMFDLVLTFVWALLVFHSSSVLHFCFITERTGEIESTKCWGQQEVSKINKSLSGQLQPVTYSGATNTSQGVKVQLATSRREEQHSKDEMQKLQQQLLQVHTLVCILCVRIVVLSIVWLDIFKESKFVFYVFISVPAINLSTIHKQDLKS